MTTNALLPVGTRVVVTDHLTRIGPGYLGQHGRVREHYGEPDDEYGAHGVTFDDPNLSQVGSWTRAALVPRAEVPIEEAYPVGSVWNHKTYGDEEFTVLGYKGASVLIGYEPNARSDAAQVWPRTALDKFGTLVRNTPTTIQEDTMTKRPTIDFSGSSRATAREYAAALNSRILSPDNQAILKQVAKGNSAVDAYRLNAAVTEALSSCATRHGQSMGRREMTKKGRYLGYIVQGVLENHADRLPAYDVGERSRLLEEVKPALTEARREVEALTRRVEELQTERGLLTQAASDERRRLCKQYDDLKASANAEVTRLHEEIIEGAAKLRGVTEDLTRHVALREFVEGNLLDEGQLDQCVGFTHGYAAAERS